MFDPSPSSGSAPDADTAVAPDRVTVDREEPWDDVERLLRDVTARFVPDPDVRRQYREATRSRRHRTCCVWFAINTMIMALVMPIAFLTMPAGRAAPLLGSFAAIALCFLLAAALLGRCRSALAEDVVVVLPCLALLLVGGIGCVLGGPALFDRHEAFNAVTICSAMTFLSAERRVHRVLIAATALQLILFGLWSGLPHTGLFEDAVYWSAALTAFSWAGLTQERGRFRLFVHRLERENQLRRVSAISDQLFRGARTDALTGVGNRLLLDERLAALAASGETLRDRWLLMVDVDHFKQLNDALGHVVGDECLRTVAASLASCLRQDDVLTRYGGEEFVALVRAPEATHAWRIAERMREAVAGLPLANPRTEAGHVTVSIGVAAIGPGGAASVIARADLALYAAKGAGRDRVAVEPGFERTAYPMPGMAIPAI